MVNPAVSLLQQGLFQRTSRALRRVKKHNTESEQRNRKLRDD